MTDTKKAPEVAWLWPTSRKPVPAKDRKNAKWEEGRWTPYDTSGSHRGSSGKVKYTRTDLSNELIAAALGCVDDRINNTDYGMNYHAPLTQCIRAFTPDDARAALEARDKRVREAALREVAAICAAWKNCGHDFDVESEVLSLIEKD